VSPVLLQRQAALAAGALLATLGVLVFGDQDEPPPALRPVEVDVEWERAVVGVLPAQAYSRETACGVRLDSGTYGVAHPLLPCGADLVVSRAGKDIRTEVVDRAPVDAGRDFELTRALAEELGVAEESAIRWRFAG
jgi:Lytic transglycolase